MVNDFVLAVTPSDVYHCTVTNTSQTRCHSVQDPVKASPTLWQANLAYTSALCTHHPAQSCPVTGLVFT